MVASVPKPDEPQVHRPAAAPPGAPKSDRRRSFAWFAGIATLIGVASGLWALATGIRDELGPPGASSGEISEFTVGNAGGSIVGVNVRVATEGFARESLTLLLAGMCNPDPAQLRGTEPQLLQTLTVTPNAVKDADLYSLQVTAPGGPGDTCIFVATLADPDFRTLASAGDGLVLA